MRMTGDSFCIISHKYRIVIFGILIEHLRLCKFCHDSAIQTPCLNQVSKHPVHIGMCFRQHKRLCRLLLLWFALPIDLSLLSAKQHRDRLRKTLIIIRPDKINCKTSFFCCMVIPSISAYGDTVITGKPLFSAGTKQLFSLPDKEVLQIHGIGPLFLFFCKINISRHLHTSCQ